MMDQKQYLHELLREDQEPFRLNSYISDRKSLLRRDDNIIQIKKRRKSIIQTSIPKQSLCKRACFFSSRDSPDVRKSPVNVPSPAMVESPCGNRNGRVLLDVPATTAALLLEAATRIKGSGKFDTRIKNCGLGLFGSVLKRIKERNYRNRMREIKDVRDQDEFGFSCGYNQRRRLSSSSAGAAAGLPESNDGKSLDFLDASSSCRSEESEQIVDSPFRFSLHRSPSPGNRTPEFSSPAASPCLHKRQDEENCENEEMEKEKEEDDKEEQCSPVSVLDHRFEDDDYRPDEEDDGEDDQCNYSMLQRAQQELLNKLQRFEQLAELDPIELEKIMVEGKEEEEEDADRFRVKRERLICCRDKEVNPYMKRLIVSDQNYSKEKNGLMELCRREFGEWKNCEEQVEEIAMEIELLLFGVLVEELSQDLSASINQILA